MSRPHPLLASHPVRFTLQVACALAMAVGSFPLTALAQSYNPPADLGLPGRREGGGTRGCWRGDTLNAANDRLTALVPAQNFGYTLAEYPSFFVYVPQFYAEGAVAAEFILSDDQDNELYKATFQTTKNSGIISLSLPASANLAPLEVGKSYHWSFSLVCDMSDRSADVVVDSWIQRVARPDLTNQLQTATPEQRPSIYAQEGIWYDALRSLVTLRSQSTGNVPASQWVNLLNSVGLVHITREAPIESVTLSQHDQTTDPEQ